MINLKFAIIFIAIIYNSSAQEILKARRSHKALDLTDSDVHKLAVLSNTTHIDVVLDNICIPRVVGTRNHKKVRNYIVKQLKELDWDVELDEFEDVTPTFGKLKFANIMATPDPNAKRFLVLACHYDSKYSREDDFVGATDSAVPCAMMLNLAKQLNPLFKQRTDDEVSIKLIFFDGEEAFRYWGPNDSLYGARHLAKKWEDTIKICYGRDRINELNRIDVLVLLDLIGVPDPKFYSYFTETEKWYIRLVQAEQRLAEMGQLKQYSRGQPQQTYFAQRSVRAHVDDDHTPFLTRGVPILHVIPSPFPEVWHKSEDNRNAIDMHTVENLNKIFRVFVSEYLHLPVNNL